MISGTAQRRVTLVLCTREGAVLGSLPPFDAPVPWWQEVADVIAAARAVHGVDVVVLRLLSTSRSIPPGDVCYLAELAGPPTVALLPWPDPTTELDHPLRQTWARPGGPAADLAWADEVLAARGTPRDRGRAADAFVEPLESVAVAVVNGRGMAQGGAPVLRPRGADAGPTRSGGRAAVDRARWSAGAARGGAGRGSARRRAAAAPADGGPAGRAAGRVAEPH